MNASSAASASHANDVASGIAPDVGALGQPARPLVHAVGAVEPAGQNWFDVQLPEMPVRPVEAQNVPA